MLLREVDLVCRVDSDAGLWLVGPGSTDMEGEEVQKLVCSDRVREVAHCVGSGE